MGVVVTAMPAFCGCCSDCFTCHKACCVPAIAVGEIAEATGQNPCGACCIFTCLTGVLPGLGNIVHGCTTSAQLREQHGLEANRCLLCCAHVCCGTCAKTQELRLIKQVRDARETAMKVPSGPVRQNMH